MTEPDDSLKSVEGEFEEGVELLPLETLLSSGIHIGTRVKTKDMKQFIYRARPDGLYVLDVRKTDERIRIAAKFISRFESSKIAVASSRLYGRNPILKFSEVVGAMPIIGRFLPGLLSNPTHSNHLEVDVLIVSDPKVDRQGVKEAALAGIPVIGICDTDNDYSDIDFVIPANNKGRKALATIYWLLARQTLREKGKLSSTEEFKISIDDFETKLVEPSQKDEE